MSVETDIVDMLTYGPAKGELFGLPGDGYGYDNAAFVIRKTGNGWLVVAAKTRLVWLLEVHVVNDRAQWDAVNEPII